MKINKDKITLPVAIDELPHRVKKYLNKYKSGSREIECTNKDLINCTVVIPAISEYENVLKLLNSLSEMDNRYFQSTLFIFVINNSESSSEEIKTNNTKTLTLLRNIIYGNIKDNFIDKINSSGLKIALVDASSEGNEMPANNAGVGYARKIGMDLALTILNYNSVEKKIIVCLDSDCIVEKNYLTEIIENFNDKNISAAVIQYSHSKAEDPEIEKAIICYEIFLNYYELGLKLAGSPYFFHSVGSTIACDYESYIKVEGMNKNKAGEDFYFLEKLIKNVSVTKINSTKVHPAPRTSWRVPFGTGQRIERFLNNTQNEYQLYNPVTFYILRDWLKVFLFGENLSADEYLKLAGKIDNSLNNFLRNQKFEESWNNISANSSGKEQLQKQKLLWFDGFRTLKLIHFLRDNGYPQIKMFDALDKIFAELKINFPDRDKNYIPDINKQKEYLELLKESIENFN